MKLAPKFVYCETTDGGMDVHEVTGPISTELNWLTGWMHPNCVEEDKYLVEWAASAEPGEYRHHRLGIVFRVCD